MAELELRLFGRFHARFASGRVVELTTRKAGALLAYLALHAGQAQSREKLIALLWSDRAEKQGRESLRQALTALRRALGSEGAAVLRVTGDTIAVEPAEVEVDASRFERLLAGGTAQDLERAVELYTGELLDGIGVRDPAFEDWVHAERERMHGRAVEALANLLAHQAESACPERAMATAARLLQLDPLQEAAHRTLMRLHARRGQRGLALRQYQACVEVLKRELGIAPHPETIALYDAIRQAREACSGSGIELARSDRADVSDDLTHAAPSASEVAPLPQNAPPAMVAPAERRHLTIVFVVLVGSMELSALLDPEHMQELLADYHKAVAKEAARFRGQVANVMGDGMLVSFGWPNAHEDDAERAVWASLAISASVGALRSPEGSPLAVRIGIASGLVVVGEGTAHEAAVVGETPNLASRLRALASPGQIVIAESTRRLLGDVFELTDLGTKTVQGIREPVQAFAVIGARPVESRFDARSGPAPLPMVGRDQELALLLERWELAKAGEGQGVLLVGEAGIGKSRIVRALLDALAEQPHGRIRYQCSPYHTDSALWPVIQQLTHAAGFGAADTSDAKLDKLEALLARADGAAGAPLIASLLGLDGEPRYGSLDLTPQAQRVRTLDALVGQALGISTRQPLLLVLEDAHWVDPTTLELIEQCLDRIAATRVLILLTSRPDDRPALAGHPHVTGFTLNRLGRASAEAIVGHLGGNKILPAAVIDAIVARTDGVPLFVEELTKAVLESGLLADVGDRLELAGPVPPLSIPVTLHDSLMARLDRLGPVKELAQIGAVIGREFDQLLLAAVAARSDDDLADALQQLVASELVLRRGSPPHATYVFKHALVQDAAYQSLLRSRRQELHARIANSIQAHFPDTLNDRPEVLAQHYAAAGDLYQAIGFWLEAGRRSLARSANLEAVSHLRRGLALVSGLSDAAARARMELELQLALGPPLIATNGYTADDTVQAFARARALCEELDDAAHLFQAIYGLWANHAMCGEHEKARRLAEEFLRLARRHDDVVPTITAHRVWGWSLSLLGELVAGKDQLEQALALYQPEEHRSLAFLYGQDPRIAALSILAWNAWLLGYPDTSAALGEQALQEGKDLNHAYTLAYATYVGGAAPKYLSRDFDGSRAQVEALLAFSEEQGFPFWLAYGTELRGALLAQERRGDDGILLTRRAAADLDRQRLGWFRPFVPGTLAGAHIANAEPERAAPLIAETLARVHETGERWIEPELHRLSGEAMLLESGEAIEAASCFTRALDLARSQSAKSWELRAAVSLARLWAEGGERQKAHDLLGPIYGWFTEGFDTADLKDAKALLDQLA